MERVLTSFPIITVADLPATRQFYERLGFGQTYQFPPEGEAAFITMERGTDSIGISAAEPGSTDRFAYWVYVDDVDASLAELEAAGAPVVEPAADQAFGERVAAVRDPAGNKVYLGAPI